MKQASLRVINQQLSELIDFDVISKEIFDGYPLHVEYKLTDFGKLLLMVIETMELWGNQNAEKVAQLAKDRNENIFL
ncbi:winged helix-turn-helix transcriptional regulator [Myroides indicus]|uniref:winged helix-turn-helix transcriptional regulator n=1 Tax=Myroides indicus TaxID=1323422 RepID=UPI00105F3410|nr:winged helix-turn-helix transcriptional regulator [Myroides indicus]